MVFSMGPLILIIITTSSFFFGREAIEGREYGQLEGFLGYDTAYQLQEIIKHATNSDKNKLATTGCQNPVEECYCRGARNNRIIFVWQICHLVLHFQKQCRFYVRPNMR
jgi:hypothetical protein